MQHDKKHTLYQILAKEEWSRFGFFSNIGLEIHQHSQYHNKFTPEKIIFAWLHFKDLGRMLI